ncbi:hypothetical protein BHE74_00048555 [Ensete ventricosum]|nr:hypothetical protein GW17_00015037 [Ensete ventricosum]RWW45588.1 hypothetical protein BHE74_00048555 [Ensete ventricosum]RZS15038.1 hypothetical protein BHM03_00046814 [Ensete ventricosum]
MVCVVASLFSLDTPLGSDGGLIYVHVHALPMAEARGALCHANARRPPKAGGSSPERIHTKVRLVVCPHLTASEWSGVEDRKQGIDIPSVGWAAIDDPRGGLRGAEYDYGGLKLCYPPEGEPSME